MADAHVEEDNGVYAGRGRHQDARTQAGRILDFSEGLRPSDSPTRSLARRFAGALRFHLRERYGGRAEAPSARRRAQLPKLNAFVGSEQALRGTTSALERYPVEHPDDRYALDEILKGGHATPLRWDRVPDLVVLMPVMQYEKGRGTEYRATSERLSDQEATQLVADLTSALGVLTDNTFQGFSSVRRESAAAGDVVNVMRPGQIVVARYNGVRDQLATIGFGGRSTRDSTIRAGSIILDNDFDRANETRRLLRMHELGHALGYNHVLSRPSIMNPKVGSEPTTFDRTAARIAFQGFRPDASSCS